MSLESIKKLFPYYGIKGKTEILLKPPDIVTLIQTGMVKYGQAE